MLQVGTSTCAVDRRIPKNKQEYNDELRMNWNITLKIHNWIDFNQHFGQFQGRKKKTDRKDLLQLKKSSVEEKSFKGNDMGKDFSMK